MMQSGERSKTKLLLRKIDKISALLNELRQSLLKELETTPRKSTKSSVSKVPLAPSTEQLQYEYEQLLSRFMSQGSQVVQDFVSEHTTRYLGGFIQANSLPISTKNRKKAIEDSLRNQLAGSLVIRGV